MNMRMIQFELILMALLLSLNAPAVTVNTGSGAYAIIVVRNPFDLKSPVVAPPPPPLEAFPSNLELTGIYVKFGRKQVLFNVKNRNGPPSSKMLTVGEVIDGIEVLSINETEGEVLVRNRGIETLLTFAKNGAKIPSGSPPVVAPQIQPPAVNTGTPIQLNEGDARGLGAMAEVSIPTRSSRAAPIPIH